MKISLKALLQKTLPYISWLKQNMLFIGILVIVSMFGWIFYRIGHFNSVSPSESAIEEQLQSVSRPKIDKAIVEKLLNLESENIQVKALFNQVRENPFSE